MSDDIASQLLHSSNARIAEAAKRVFSTSYPISVMATCDSTTTNPVLDAEMGSFRSCFSSAADSKESHCYSPIESLEPFSSLENNQKLEGDDDKQLSSTDRLKRSRERNRMHARKTRQRKKEHMHMLQNRVDSLKLEQIRIKQAINEKNTASILVGLFQSGPIETENKSLDPKVESLLKRATEDIPDASKIPELPALILPGQHGNKRKSHDDETDRDPVLEDLQEDGIDYELLRKERSACSPAELDMIRRERNRMHAKRTRERKRVFMEEMEVMIKQLEEENALLKDHGISLNGNVAADSSSAPPLTVSPVLGPMAASAAAPFSTLSNTSELDHVKQLKLPSLQPSPPTGDFLNQIESLLAAAGQFSKRCQTAGEINAISCAESDVSASTNNSEHGSLSEDDDERCCEKQQLQMGIPSSVPSSITTTQLL